MAIKYGNVRFEASYGSVAQLPESDLPEVAFAGRSNVGKSSLMNKLFGRKSLVKVSSKPGKTANVNFFEADGVHFVDLPGYGFAQVSKAERQRWADLIDGYLTTGRDIRLIVVLVDIRLDAQRLDLEMVDYLRGNELPFIVALTKADKISRSKQSQQKARLARAFGLDPMALVVTSATKGTGMGEIKAFIERAVA